MAPGAPWGPADPAAPRGPSGPLVPAGPLPAVGPLGPAMPCAPARPAGPMGPGCPMAPDVNKTAESAGTSAQLTCRHVTRRRRMSTNARCTQRCAKSACVPRCARARPRYVLHLQDAGGGRALKSEMRTGRTDGPNWTRTAAGASEAWQSARALRSKEARRSCLASHTRRPRNANVSTRAAVSWQPF